VRILTCHFFGEKLTFCFFIRSITSTLELIVHSNFISSYFTSNFGDFNLTFASFTFWKPAGGLFLLLTTHTYVAVRPDPVPIRTVARLPYCTFYFQNSRPPHPFTTFDIAPQNLSGWAGPVLPICPAGGLGRRGSEAQEQVVPGPYLGPSCTTLRAMVGGPSWTKAPANLIIYQSLRRA